MFSKKVGAEGHVVLADINAAVVYALEKYLNAADRSVRTAMFGPAKLDPAIVHYPLPVRINLLRDQQALPKDLFHYDHSGLSMVMVWPNFRKRNPVR